VFTIASPPRGQTDQGYGAGGVDFADYINDCTKSPSNSMKFAVRGIPQHTFRVMRLLICFL
jgi:hypothetical protein